MKKLKATSCESNLNSVIKDFTNTCSNIKSITDSKMSNKLDSYVENLKLLHDYAVNIDFTSFTCKYKEQMATKVINHTKELIGMVKQFMFHNNNKEYFYTEFYIKLDKYCCELMDILMFDFIDIEEMAYNQLKE